MAKVKSARAKIEEALKRATFATAHFGSQESDVDRICKAETQIYRESWLIPALMQAMVNIDPCKPCKGRGRVWEGVAMSATRVECSHCKGTKVSGGLSFDPYKLSLEAVEKAGDMKEIQQVAEELARK